MKSIRLHGPGSLRLHHEFELWVHEEQAMVQVKATGTCDSDLYRSFEDDYPFFDSPVTTKGRYEMYLNGAGRELSFPEDISLR